MLSIKRYVCPKIIAFGR